MLLNPFAEEALTLISRINSSSARLLSRYMDAYGITWAQGMTLMALYQQDNQTLGALSDLIGCYSSNLSPLCKRLEERGFVHRQRAEEDQRVVRIHLTDQGKALVELFLSQRGQLYLNPNPTQQEVILRGLRELEHLLRETPLPDPFVPKTSNSKEESK